jgi:uncharacterized DUF497 family protein
MRFSFDERKNELLIKERGVCFQDVIEAIAEDGILLDFEHPNHTKYPEQRVLVVGIGGYSFNEKI